jgi:hypothetical protein
MIQTIDFNGFSEPILIPQFGTHLVKFIDTGKIDKNGETEKINFINQDGESYVFNAEDVQKSGKSDFYINLKTLRRYYDIKFDDNNERYIPNLNQKDIQSLFQKSYDLFTKNKTNFDKFSQTVKKIITEIFSKNIGEFKSTPCDMNIEGIINIFPKRGAVDDNQNTWSLLNQLPYNTITLKILLKQYIQKYKTFELNEFLTWIDDNSKDILTNDVVQRIVKEISHDDNSNKVSSKLLNKVFNTNDISYFTCPNQRHKTNMIVINFNNSLFKIQLLKSRYHKIFHDGDYYYVVLSSRNNNENINYDANFILFMSGSLFSNHQIKREILNLNGKKVNTLRFKQPPIIGSEQIVNI